MLKLLAWLTGRKVVYLMDHDGEVNRRLAKETPFGLTTKRIKRNCVAGVLLLPDGNTRGKGYVISWKLDE